MYNSQTMETEKNKKGGKVKNKRYISDNGAQTLRYTYKSSPSLNVSRFPLLIQSFGTMFCIKWSS